MKYTIPILPPSWNKYAGRKNTWEYREEKKRWKDIVKAYCRPVPREPIQRASVTICYFFRDNIRRDPDNYAGKMILDGLVSAGILLDDDFDHIDLVIKKGGVDRKNPRVEIEIKLPGETGEGH